ncbi:MAG: GNAT family protein [Pseudomonadota bacterium]
MLRLRLFSKVQKKLIDVPGHELFFAQPSMDHFEAWLEVRTHSQQFLQPWEPSWPDDDLSLIGYRRRLRAYERHRQSGWGRTFFLFDGNNRELLGGVSLTRISYGMSMSTTLGYWMGERHANQGIMKKSVPAILSFAFDDLGLKRVEAACLPENQRSRHLLRKCGFRQEGYAKEYLEINGKREDHVLFGILASDFRRHRVR